MVAAKRRAIIASVSPAACRNTASLLLIETSGV